MSHDPKPVIATWVYDEWKKEHRLLINLLAILSNYAHEDGAGGIHGEGAVDTLERITNELDKFRCHLGERAFLIERLHPERGGVTIYWDGVDFTDWSQSAVRFAREQDAARMIYCYGWKEGFAHVGRHDWQPAHDCEHRGRVTKPSPPPNHDLRTGDYPKDQVDPVGWARWWERKNV